MHAFRFPVTQREQSDFNIFFFIGDGDDPVKNALFTGFAIFYCVKNIVKVESFLTGFSQGLSQVFSLGKI